MQRTEAEELEVPEEARTLDGFRRWVARLGEDAPRVHFWQGQVTLEMGQDPWNHGAVTEAIQQRLRALTRDRDLGRFLSPPTWITCVEAGLSTEPDGFLVTWETLEAGELRRNPDRKNEMLGRPDLAIEVVSDTSERKDTVELVEAYARAGVAEYWIADGREERSELRILVRGDDGTYEEQEAEDGWLASPTYRKPFRLGRFTDRAGLPDFELEVRA